MTSVASDRDIDRIWAHLGPQVEDWAEQSLLGLFVKNGPYKRDWSHADRGHWSMFMDQLGWPRSLLVWLPAGVGILSVGDAARLLGDDEVFPVSLPDLKRLGRHKRNAPLPVWLERVVAAVRKAS